MKHYAQITKRINKVGQVRYGFNFVTPDMKISIKCKWCDLKTVAGVKRVISKNGFELINEEIKEV